MTPEPGCTADRSTRRQRRSINIAYMARHPGWQVRFHQRLDRQWLHPVEPDNPSRALSYYEPAVYEWFDDAG